VELPSGTVTFLFTDIEGSTRLWREDPEAMRPALERHDAIVRELVDAHGGYVVKTTGDGVHAAFSTASAAVDAAVAAQLALAREEWPLPGPLRVRMGVHSGPADLRDGDYYGTTVNRAARLMSIAHGGQIVVSSVTQALLAEGSVDLLDLGEHSLRDLGRAERVYQVQHPNLEREFPPLMSLHASAGNLPVQTTSFVGRGEDLVRIADLLDRGRLLTLVGTGGVGKTRLAVQFAVDAAPEFQDGTWFCELAGADGPDSMVQVVASTLGCVQHPGLSLSESVVQYLKVRSLLLLLDNCEHVLAAAAQLAPAIVQSCPHVTVVVTSREALDLPGERVLRVQSLTIPEGSGGETALLESASVELFRDRARDVGAQLTWNDQQWAAVGDICRRVDGIPLAIELAAARTLSMSPIDVARHLDERFRLLTGKRHARVERHQTLRATVEWSYQLLTGDERAVFDRVGAFTGGFDEAAAIAVAGDHELDAWTVTDAIASLVAKSMLVVDTGPDGTSRYSMLETLRQFARESLDSAGGADHYRRAHATYFAEFARDIALGFLGHEHTVWLARLRADQDNIRAAIGWALDRDETEDQDLGLATLAALAWAGDMYPDVGLGALAIEALELTQRASAELRVPILAVAAVQHWHKGDIDTARHLVQLAVGDGFVSSTINPLTPFVEIVTIEMSVGNAVQAFEHAEQARSYLTESNDFDASRFLSGLSTFETMAGKSEAALADSNESLQIAQRTGNEYLVAAALSARAWARQRSNPEGALADVEQMLDIHRRTGVARSIATVGMAVAAGLRARLGDDQGAFALLRDALVVARDDGTLPQTTGILGYAIMPLYRTGRADVAATFIGALDHGAVAHVRDFPGTATRRARTLAEIRGARADDADRWFARGADMTYDELLQYAIEQLDRAAGAGMPSPS
jgi:predicted ATPase/class 3 adenylate cyclase